MLKETDSSELKTYCTGTTIEVTNLEIFHITTQLTQDIICTFLEKYMQYFFLHYLQSKVFFIKKLETNFCKSYEIVLN